MSPNKAEPIEVDSNSTDMQTRFEIRFFMKKSKRFDTSRRNYRKESNTSTEAKESSVECLMYLGLAPKGKMCNQLVTKQKKQTDFEFPKPRIYECYQCSKFFYHEFLLQRHTVCRHKKNKKRLISNLWKKKQKLLYRNNEPKVSKRLQSFDSLVSNQRNRQLVNFPRKISWISKAEIEKYLTDSDRF
ncbi:uncharacterized protein LOC143264467 [Megachile rotundata]|uniref:uncharacterized protein LOC143264467 n=1 Tax=Megachile rotundata TaxID=143995 RepID=UPI003FD0A905